MSRLIVARMFMRHIFKGLFYYPCNCYHRVSSMFVYYYHAPCSGIIALHHRHRPLGSLPLQACI